ncbi:MAG: glycosyltransferase family A protein [Lachnospiraceae bacterium]
MDNRQMTVAVLIPTYRPDKRFSRLLQMLSHQTWPVTQIVVMNTEQSLWNEHGYDGISGLEVHHIRKADFDHGKTRHQGMEYVTTDICICMTQDAVPADQYLVEQLVLALEQEEVAVAYARQLPDKDCRFIERYTRSFNYPAESMLKRKADLPRLGIKTYFCSNVCAAYNMKYYKQSDGFIRRTIFNEDMIYAAGVIAAGYGIAYTASACVIHSHNYNGMQQLKRNFDLAVSQAEHPEIFSGLKSEGEGIRLVKQTAKYLAGRKKWYLLPQLFIQSGCKYLGFLLGKHYQALPQGLIRRLTMSPGYWEND